MSVTVITAKKYRWVHLDGDAADVGAYLREQFKFHPLDIEDVTTPHQRPKVDLYKYYLFLIAVFPYFDADEKHKVRGHEVDIFLTADTLVTIAKKPFPALTALFERVAESGKLQHSWLERSPAFLLYKLLEIFFRDTNGVITLLTRRLAEVEHDIYENESRGVTRELAFVRRAVLALRRIIDPQRVTITALTDTKRSLIPAELIPYFDNIQDYLEKFWVEADSLRDVTDGLHLTNEALVSQHTNRIIKILTVFSVSLLPLTLLSGIYGMNLDHLPYAEEPIVVWGLFGGLAVIIIGIIVWLYRQERF